MIRRELIRAEVFFKNKGSAAILMNVEKVELELPQKNELHLTDKWILSKLNNSIELINQQYADYKLNEVIKTMYEFVYDYFCDWYIEFTKTRFYGNDIKDKRIAEAVSIHVLKNILQLLHPFIPHVTEEIWSFLNIKKDKLLINHKIADSNKKLIDDKIENDINIIIQTITAVRNIKANLNVQPGKVINIEVRGNKNETDIIENNLNLLNRMAKIEKIIVGENLKKPNQSATAVINKMEMFIPLKGLIDINKEIDRLNKQVEDMKGRLNAVYQKLNNPSFVDRAPKEIVSHENNKKTNYEDTLKKLEDNLKSLME